MHITYLTFFLNDPATTEIYTLSLHDALPISANPFDFSEIQARAILDMQLRRLAALERQALLDEYQELMERITYLEDLRSEEHTSELQSRLHLVCRLLLEKKKK